MNARRSSSVLCLCLLLLGSMACAFHESDSDVASTAGAIVGADYDDTAPSPDFPAVVRLPNCTGTLISPSHVLTAAHCAAEGAPASVWFVSRDAERTDDNKFDVAGCALHPGFIRNNVDFVRPEYRIGTDAEILDRVGERCGVLVPITSLLRSDTLVDFAVLTLARPVPHPVADPTSIAAGIVFVSPESVVETPPGLGETFSAIAVGFGATLSMESIRIGTRRVRRFSPSMPSGVLRASILGPQDSGGPLFVETPSGRAVLGVASTGDSWGLLDRADVRAWIRAKLDADGDGRADISCPRGPGGSYPDADAGTDSDGDGILGAEDTCPSTYNPCQVSTDVDGDGFLDDCDACPSDSSVARFRGDPLLSDADTDGLADVCDCRLGVFDPPADPDYDFVRSSCDNCAFDFNPLQENRDGDASGDACDGCPGTADTGGDGGDGDGVPNACDNCPLVPNPDQANCNADAELAEGLLSLDLAEGLFGTGDACDPIPCGDTRAASATRVFERGGLAFRGVGTSSVLVDAIATEAFVGRTGFRVCRCSAAQDDDVGLRAGCISEQLDGTGLCGVVDIAAYRDPEENDRWRLPSLDHGDANGDGVIDLADARAEPILSYDARARGFAVDHGMDWDLDRDLDRWERVFGDVYPTDPIGVRRPVSAILWTRTPGSPTSDFASDSPEESLAHHYTSGPLSPPAPARAPFPCYDFIAPLLSNPSFCPICPGAFPGPWLAFPGCEPAPFIPPALVLEGTFLDAAPSFAVDLAELFAEPGVWIAASEPDPWLPKQGVRYANVLDDGAIAHVLVETTAGLADRTQKPPPPPPCDNPNGCFALLARADRPTTSSSVHVLSSRRNLLFTFRSHQLIVQDLEAGTTRFANDPLEPLGVVLAATYDPAADALAVLDEVGVEAGRRGRTRRATRVRLLRVEPTSGSVRVLATFPRTGVTRRFALAPTPSGALFLAASGDHGPHVVVLLDAPWTEPRLAGVTVAPGAIVPGQARADVRGLTVVVEERRGSRLVGYEAELLRAIPPRRWPACF